MANLLGNYIVYQDKAISLLSWCVAEVGVGELVVICRCGDELSARMVASALIAAAADLDEGQESD